MKTRMAEDRLASPRLASMFVTRPLSDCARICASCLSWRQKASSSERLVRCPRIEIERLTTIALADAGAGWALISIGLIWRSSMMRSHAAGSQFYDSLSARSVLESDPDEGLSLLADASAMRFVRRASATTTLEHRSIYFLRNASIETTFVLSGAFRTSAGVLFVSLLGLGAGAAFVWPSPSLIG